MPVFANPLALWALLGIPIVLGIHFLQRRSRRVKVTTLFLLQQLQRESEQGNRIERLRSSIPLWLQLLMVLLFTWLLAAPSWTRKDAVYRIAIVLDSSASMQAFRPEAETAVQAFLRKALPLGSQFELALLGTDSSSSNLYYGDSSTALLEAMPQWQPLLGTHDFSPALRSARSLVGPEGAVLLVTDHVPAAEWPFEAKTLSIGHSLPNVGWAGLSVEEKDGQWFWRALVTNYGSGPQMRDWQVTVDGASAPPSKLALAPRETRTLSGPFPEKTRDGGLQLVLTADAFSLDDQMPLLRPQPKSLALHLPASGKDENSREITALFRKFAHVSSASQAGKADVRVIVWPPSIALEPDQNACVFSASSRDANAPTLRGQIVTEAHPLVEGLNWQSLLVRESMVVPGDPRDRVLLWQGTRPLISLRETPSGARQLFCHFDLVTSNALKLPAVAVLLHRFLETLRRDKIEEEQGNYDLRQRLHIAHRAGNDTAPLGLKTSTGESESVPLHQTHLLRAPARPSFFEVSQNGQMLLRGAAHFADTREADLSLAGPFDETSSLNVRQTESLLETDPNRQLWSLCLLVLLLSSWWWGRGRNLARPAAATPGKPASV
ncbi:MAG TPA: BatA domain-containing protein [Prosthecobacter sp.]